MERFDAVYRLAHDPLTHERRITFAEALQLPTKDLDACDVIRAELIEISRTGWGREKEDA